MTQKKLTLQLDFHSGLPIYTQITNQIQSQLANGTLKPGDQLPTVRTLAQQLSINFNTVARAYRLLNKGRIISTQQGRGTYVLESLPPKMREKLKHEALAALAQRFINEAFRLGFSKPEISLMMRNNLKLGKNEVEKSAG